MQIKGNTFIVTGGSSGLGAATARLIGKRGGRVAIADLSSETGEALANSIGNESAFFVKTDVTDEVSVKAAIEIATEKLGGLRGVVNCAGIAVAERVVGKRGPHDLASFVRVIQVNLVGTFNVIRLAAARMASQEATSSGERGVIINTASIAAYDGQIGQCAYAASKGGIVGLTLPAARDLARHAIRVATIAPGIFDTPLLGSLPPDVRQALGAQVPFPSRIGRPEEYAALVCHIIENEMLNGEVIRLDGALRMAPQ
jgi:NAD(P)-dependent dehydrogenase (short-subunit alcohol dehydrogenase family)